jgi:hypothetical protein
MKLLIYCGLALSLIGFAGCRTGKPDTVGVIAIPFERADVIDLEQFIDRVKYVQLENHPESAFTDIDKMIVNGENIFMLDKRLEAVFCFDTAGRFRYRIQRVGRGPGEYQELEAMWIKPEARELWLQSFWPAKIMVYNFEGQMIREFSFLWPAKDMVGIGDNLILGFNPTPTYNGSDTLKEGLFLIDEKGNHQRQALVLGDTTIYWTLGYQRNMEMFDSGALLLSQSDTIFKIDKAGHVTADSWLDWRKLKYPEELRKVCFSDPGYQKAMQGDYVTGKDQLIAFGPVRLFRVFMENHIEFALADMITRKGIYSTQLSCKIAGVPLLFPMTKSDQGDLVGIFDMSILQAMKESKEQRRTDLSNQDIFKVMDSLVESAMNQDRPVLWFAKIKQEWLNKTY